VGQIQPGRIESRRCKCAVTAFQNFPHPRGWPGTRADMNQATHEITHHMMQKAVSAEVAKQVVAAPLDPRQAEFLDRRSGLTFGRTERREIMLPDQVTCGLTCRQLDATITNTGYETAHNVCITLTIHTSRDEIISVNGNPALQQCVGDIAAGASKTEPITVNADCGAFATKCIGETLTLGTTATSDERTVQFPDQQVAV